MITKDHFYQDLLHARFLLKQGYLVFNIVMMAVHLKIVRVDACGKICMLIAVCLQEAVKLNLAV